MNKSNVVALGVGVFHYTKHGRDGQIGTADLPEMLEGFKNYTPPPHKVHSHANRRHKYVKRAV